METKKNNITESKEQEVKGQEPVWQGFTEYDTYLTRYDLQENEEEEYMGLDSLYTGLPVYIFVDKGGAYKRLGHPLWLYMCNGYSNDARLLPISISKTPSVLLPEYQLNISEEDLQKVYTYIIENYDHLVHLANGEIRDMDFTQIFLDRWYLERTTANRAEIEHSKQCGCVSCLKIFDASEVVNYIHDKSGDTALCPYCFTDAVIGDACGTPIKRYRLKVLNMKWF